LLFLNLKKIKIPKFWKEKNTLKSRGKALANTSNFTWITFVEEDCSKLPANTLSASLKMEIYTKPFKIDIFRKY
jgi:hypothetical protein